MHPAKRLLLSAAALGLLLLAVPARAQDDGSGFDADFNFAYSAVLGTGYYATATERVLVLQLPLSWRFGPFGEKNHIRALFPVAFGVTDLVGDDGGLEIPSQLLTASFLPGVAWERQITGNWTLIPSVQLGFAQDYQNDVLAWLYSIALRSYAWWDIGKHRLGLGNRVLGAGQTIDGSGSQTGFALLENGLDWEYPLPWSLWDRPLSSSVFLMWQYFADEVRIEGISGENVNLTHLFQLGFTFGFRDTVTVMGFIPVKRIGFSVVRGNTVSGREIKAYTLNLGFPLSHE